MSRRRVFALIIDANGRREGKILLQSQNDAGDGWIIPEIYANEGEIDQEALARLLREITPSEFEIFGKVGGEYELEDATTAVAYACKIHGFPTLNAKFRADLCNFMSSEDLIQKSAKVGGVDFPVILAGSRKKLNHMGRMIWDAFSFKEFMSLLTQKYGPQDNPQVVNANIVGERSESLVFQENNLFHYYDRLDPFSPTGKM